MQQELFQEFCANLCAIRTAIHSKTDKNSVILPPTWDFHSMISPGGNLAVFSKQWLSLVLRLLSCCTSDRGSLLHFNVGNKGLLQTIRLASLQAIGQDIPLPTDSKVQFS